MQPKDRLDLIIMDKICSFKKDQESFENDFILVETREDNDKIIKIYKSKKK